MNSGSESSIPEIDASNAWKLANSGQGLILDVREPEELEQVSIDGVLHVPLGSIQGRVSEIPRDRDVYVVCHVGQRSAMVTEYLRSLGYERVWNVRGGVIAWLRSGLPARWNNAR